MDLYLIVVPWATRVYGICIHPEPAVEHIHEGKALEDHGMADFSLVPRPPPTESLGTRLGGLAKPHLEVS